MRLRALLIPIISLASTLLSGLLVVLAYHYVRFDENLRLNEKARLAELSFTQKLASIEALAFHLLATLPRDRDGLLSLADSLQSSLHQQLEPLLSLQIYEQVEHQQRGSHERMLQSRFKVKGLTDSSFDDGEAKTPSPEAKSYVSLLYRSNQDLARDIGWNALSDPRRKQGLETCFATGSACLSPAFSTEKGRRAMEIFLPLINRDQSLGMIVSLTIDLNLLIKEQESFAMSRMLYQKSNQQQDWQELIAILEKDEGEFLRLGQMNRETISPFFQHQFRLLLSRDWLLSRSLYPVLGLASFLGFFGVLYATRFAKTLVQLASRLRETENKKYEQFEGLKQQQADLEKWKAENLAIKGLVSEGLLSCTTDLRIESGYNEACERILARGSLVGLSLHDSLFKDLDPQQAKTEQHFVSLALLFGADESQWRISFEQLLPSIPYQLPDGTMQTLYLRYAPLYDEEGEMERLLIRISTPQIKPLSHIA